MVYSLTRSGLDLIAKEASATPGVYARDKSLPLAKGLVALTSSFPGFGYR